MVFRKKTKTLYKMISNKIIEKKQMKLVEKPKNIRCFKRI